MFKASFILLPLTSVEVVVRAKQAQLPSPVANQLRMRGFQVVPERKGTFDAAVCCQWAVPALFEGKQACCSGIGHIGREVDAAILRENRVQVLSAIPR